GDISLCKNLTVLYLQNNCLTKIENIDYATHLTHLYLQANKINKIENLNGLKKLKKLYLGHNCIAVIEGLDKLCNLQELHIQKQNLPQGETLHFDPRTTKSLAVIIEGLDKLCNLQELHIQKQNLPQGETLHFDPRTTKSLARCLRILDISANGLTSIAELENLLELQHLIARNNCINNINDITDTVSHWTCLTEMELQGNPVCLHQKYRERIITCSNSLG
ncbi:Protein phosphatase 1 regulatory subunit 42, partial [Blattella germanica]